MFTGSRFRTMIFWDVFWPITTMLTFWTLVEKGRISWIWMGITCG